MNPKPIVWEQHGHIGCIKLNRPDELNTFHYEALVSLGEIIEEIEQNPRDIRAVIVSGEGRAFCAGADLKERRTLNEQQVRRNVRKIRDVFFRRWGDCRSRPLPPSTVLLSAAGLNWRWPAIFDSLSKACSWD